MDNVTSEGERSPSPLKPLIQIPTELLAEIGRMRRNVSEFTGVAMGRCKLCPPTSHKIQTQIRRRMAKRQITKLAQAIQLGIGLPADEMQTLLDLLRLQLNPPKKSATSPSSRATAAISAIVKQLRERTGATTAHCKDVLVETAGDIDTAEQLLRARKLAPKSITNDVEG